MTKPNWILIVQSAGRNGKVSEQTFEGIIPFSGDHPVMESRFQKLAIVFYEGSYEVFALQPDNPIALDELRRFLRSALGRDDDLLIKVYDQCN
jgi:hypothetical protein